MKSPRHTLPYLALASVCFFWGTTYTGIRMALESFPPLLLVGTRFTISGSILLAVLLARGTRLPPRRDLAASALFGLVILGVGNSCLTFAETWIASSLAALFVTTSPFWLTGLEAALGGERLRGAALAGMVIGLAGTALLIGPGWEQGLSGNVLKGFLVLQLGCFSWSFGSIMQRRRLPEMNAVLNGAIQQLSAGIGFLLLAFLLPEQPVEWSVRGAGAVLYLVVFGSIVGYTSYIYALKTLPVALVALHNYVNPAVAAVLGWLLFGERFGARDGAAMAVIFAGVFLVSRASLPGRLSAPARGRGAWRPSLRQESGGA